MALTKLNFQEKVVKFTNYFMYKYNPKMLRDNNQETNVSSSNKCKFCNKIPLCKILDLGDLAPLWKMAFKKVFNFSTKK